MTISQASDAFTTAFKVSLASTLGISSTDIDNVTYRQTRRQLLAGIIVYSLSCSSRCIYRSVHSCLTGLYRELFL